MSNSESPKIAQIDTNLLVSLDVLLQERSVSRAAKRRGVTQSAMSQSLARLRGVFDDPLLVRAGSTMKPTPRALTLSGPLHRALRELQAVVSEQPSFDPQRSERVFEIATTDYASSIILPALLDRMAILAPRTRLHVRPVDASTIAEQMLEGEVDLVLGAVGPFGKGLLEEPLFEETLVCLARRGHPLLRRRVTLEAYAAAEHILVTPRGRPGGRVDTALAEHGLERTVVMNVPYFLAAPLIVMRSDVIVTLPRRIAATFTQGFPVKMFEPPLSLPGFEVQQFWHERFDHEPGLVWLRQCALEAAREA